MMYNSQKNNIQDILTTGRMLFRNYGFCSTTYKLIAGEANVSGYMLRRYFRQKKKSSEASLRMRKTKSAKD